MRIDTSFFAINLSFAAKANAIEEMNFVFIINVFISESLKEVLSVSGLRYEVSVTYSVSYLPHT